MAVVGCDSCCKSVRYPEQQGFRGSKAPELLCSQGATQGRCSSRDLCSGLAQAGAGGQGGTGLHPAWPSVCWWRCTQAHNQGEAVALSWESLSVLWKRLEREQWSSLPLPLTSFLGKRLMFSRKSFPCFPLCKTMFIMFFCGQRCAVYVIVLTVMNSWGLCFGLDVFLQGQSFYLAKWNCV